MTTGGENEALDLRVPPVVVLLVFAGGIWLVDAFAPAFRFSLPGTMAIATALGVAGVFVVLGVAAFARARTTVSPTAPGAASALVVTGIYRLTETPCT